MRRIVTVCGTSRPGNFTRKALTIVEKELGQHPLELNTFDAGNMTLAFPGAEGTEDARRLRDAVGTASGIVIATPEYHGGFSAMTKLVIENLGFPSALQGKPVALLGVAAGRIHSSSSGGFAHTQGRSSSHHPYRSRACRTPSMTRAIARMMESRTRSVDLPLDCSSSSRTTCVRSMRSRRWCAEKPSLGPQKCESRRQSEVDVGLSPTISRSKSAFRDVAAPGLSR